MSESFESPGAKLRAIDFSPRTLGLLRPLSGPLTYLGLRVGGRDVPVYAFFDHTCRAIAYPMRFAVTTCRDWRGGQLTYDKHLGTDFVVPVGTPVTAAAAGVVLAARHEPVGGHYLWIDHGGGYSTVYQHLSVMLVREGQKVARGELIAKSGGTGLAIETFFPLVPPHLHFALFIDGVPADPFPGEASPGFWAGGTDPRPYDFEAALDLPLSEEGIAKSDLLAAFAEDELLATNFIPPLQALAPERFSHGGDWRNLWDRPRLAMSLPFRAEDVSRLAF
ncbi:M23 family metallopeptidase [bacterium]|nr:M23 family metallopeptidase [bacterium]